MPELKPCPFCGSKVDAPYYYDPYDGYQGQGLGQYVIRCSRCLARVKQDTKEEAIEAWNRRFTDEK